MALSFSKTESIYM